MQGANRILAGVLALLCTFQMVRAEERPHVLFIAVDDLRPQLACYGEEMMVTPHLDQLANSGTLFRRAYCMVPTCGASRASLMTGLRPRRDRFVSYTARADRDAPNVVPLHRHFRDHGYYTVSLGKVLHFANDSIAGWSEPPWRPQRPGYHLAESRELASRRAREAGNRGRGPAWEAADAPDADYGDGQLADRAIADLRRLSERDQPFFLAVGFFKPHLPFVAPQRYWDLYDAADIRLPDSYHRPEGAPEAALHQSGELRAYAGIPPRGPVDDETARRLIHGYYACVSFIDAQIGRVLAEVDRLGLTEDTVVVLWGDHGWNLGEHLLWCKHCCFETSMRTALMMRVPGYPAGQRADGLVELIDVYPTLCEVAELPLPGHLAGLSLGPILRDEREVIHDYASGRFRNGDTIRSDQFRYSEYADGQGRFLGRMLYDHRVDPAENRNVVDAESREADVRRLQRELQSRIRNATETAR